MNLGMFMVYCVIEADTMNQSCLIILGAYVLHNMYCESIDDLKDISGSYNNSELDNVDYFAITGSTTAYKACEKRRKTTAEIQYYFKYEGNPSNKQSPMFWERRETVNKVVGHTVVSGTSTTFK